MALAPFCLIARLCWSYIPSGYLLTHLSFPVTPRYTAWNCEGTGHLMGRTDWVRLPGFLSSSRTQGYMRLCHLLTTLSFSHLSSLNQQMETIMLHYFKPEIHPCHINRIRAFTKLLFVHRSLFWLVADSLLNTGIASSSQNNPLVKNCRSFKGTRDVNSLDSGPARHYGRIPYFIPSSVILWVRPPVLLLLVSLGKESPFLIVKSWFKNITQMFWTMPPVGAKWQVVKQINFVRPCVISLYHWD